MDKAPETSPQKPRLTLRDRLMLSRLWLVRIALLLAVLAPLAIGGGMFGVRQEMFDGEVGMEKLALTVAPALAVAAGAVGLLALLLAVLLPPRRGQRLALLAIAIAAVTYGGVASFKLRTAKAPPIHDVATDWTDPLMYGMTVMAARSPNGNPAPANPVIGERSGDTALAGRRIADINAATCPAALPVVLEGGADAAFDKAKAAIAAERMTLITENKLVGRLEASRATPWFGFRDDLLIRIKPEGAGVRIDMRSSRRTGVSDHGDNCALIATMRKRLGG